MTIKKLRLGIAFVAVIAMVGAILSVDYTDLAWNNNKGNYLGIISGLLVIVSMILSNRHDAQKKQIKIKTDEV